MDRTPASRERRGAREPGQRHAEGPAPAAGAARGSAAHVLPRDQRRPVAEVFVGAPDRAGG